LLPVFSALAPLPKQPQQHEDFGVLDRVEVREQAQAQLSGAAPSPTVKPEQCGQIHPLRKDHSIAKDEIALESDNHRGE
jgi:hypothetical protein